MAATGVYYSLTTSRLDAQMQQIDQLDAKAATAYTFASVILTFFAGLLTIAVFPANEGIRVTDFILLGLAGLGYLFLVYCIFQAYEVGQWSLRPDLVTLQKYAADHTEDEMQQWIANECLLSIQANEPRIAEKARWLHRAIIALAIESVLIASVGGVTLLAK
jgi:hypothetical protein